MNKKLFLSVILAMVLVFGITVGGCDNDPSTGNNDTGNNDSSGDNTQTSLNGTWVSNSVYGEVLWFGNGNYEFSRNSYREKGTYTASSGSLSFKPTHVWGENYDIGPYWVSEAQMPDIYSGNFERWGGNYSLSGGNTLIFDGETYIKRS